MGGESAGNRTAVRCGTSASIATSTTPSKLGTATSRSRTAPAAPLRPPGRTGQLDLDGTIAATARNAGWLDLLMRPERHNAVKVLIFFDVGGSMDDHVKVCEELFSACRAEFKHLSTSTSTTAYTRACGATTAAATRAHTRRST